ncbi:hypothetical protein AZ030_004816 [Escherichia coli]|nr:hypothetical protein AZ030_004816 [Escherichia coli]
MCIRDSIYTLHRVESLVRFHYTLPVFCEAPTIFRRSAKFVRKIGLLYTSRSVYIFLAIVLWILPILLIIYLYFCIVDNEFLRIGFCIVSYTHLDVYKRQVLWILPILLIIYLYFCIVDNEFLRIGFCIAWTAYYFLSLFKYFVKYFFPLDREDLLNLMDLAKDSPDAKQELLERLLSGKRMTGRDEMDIKRILKTKEALDNIRNFIDKQQLTNNDTPKKSTVPNEDKKGIR